MTLDKKLKAVAAVGLLSAFLPVFGKHIYIKMRLEPDALLCSPLSNFQAIDKYNLPLTRNMDLDGDGKYESAKFYIDEIGRKMYQEITLDPSGNRIYGEPRLYE